MSIPYCTAKNDHKDKRMCLLHGLYVDRAFVRLYEVVYMAWEGGGGGQKSLTGVATKPAIMFNHCNVSNIMWQWRNSITF